jgi:ethanolamine utilization cobalamin adenosyltransferase
MSQTNLQTYIHHLEDKLSKLSYSIAEIESSITHQAKSFVEEKKQIDVEAREQSRKTEVPSMNIQLETRNEITIKDEDIQKCLNQMYKL